MIIFCQFYKIKPTFCIMYVFKMDQLHPSSIIPTMVSLRYLWELLWLGLLWVCANLFPFPSPFDGIFLLFMVPFAWLLILAVSLNLTIPHIADKYRVMRKRGYSILLCVLEAQGTTSLSVFRMHTGCHSNDMALQHLQGNLVIRILTV